MAGVRASGVCEHVCVCAHGQNPTSAVLGPTLGSGETRELAHGAGSRVVSRAGGLEEQTYRLTTSSPGGHAWASPGCQGF